MRIIDFEKRPAIADPVTVLPCPGAGGNMTIRTLDIKLDDKPRIKPTADSHMPPVEFPFKVSSSDPEVFRLSLSGRPCVCSWRLALDWRSQGQNGTTIIDHGFDKIKTASFTGDAPSYSKEHDGWVRRCPNRSEHSFFLQRRYILSCCRLSRLVHHNARWGILDKPSIAE
jgi:hypothetical protein